MAVNPDPDELLRDAVAAELTALTARGGAASPDSARATHRIYYDDASRALLHKQLIDDYLDLPIRGHGVGTAVITAGPAGAGKSTAIQAVLGAHATRYRRLDADIVKDTLLTHAIDAGVFDDLLTTTLSDGRAIAPRELASLVHHESTKIWDALRRHCIDRGEPIIIEGTLTWPPLGSQILSQLRGGGYTEIAVIAVEVPELTAQRRAMRRWWEARAASTDVLGGRFTPPDVIAHSYQPDGTSICLTHAASLVNEARAFDDITVTFDVVDQTGTPTRR